MSNYTFNGKIKVIDIIELSDGSAKVTFEADEEFKKEFKKYFKLKRWSQKKFSIFLDEAIKHTHENLLKENASNKKSHQ